MADATIYYRRKILDTNESSLVLNADGDSLDNDIFLESGQNNLVLQVTEQQYIELLSCALNGAYTTYPEKALTVIYPLIKAGKLEFCEQVIQCIENDPETRQALSDYFNYQNLTLTDTINSTIAGSNLISDTTGCNNDKLFGAVTGLVDFMNQLAEDFLEMLANSTNFAGRLGDMIEAVPVVNLLPVDDLFQMIESFTEDFAQNYSAYYTTTLRDQYRCDIFCFSKDTCNFDWQELFDYFNAQLVQAIIPDNLADFLDYFVNGVFAGEQIVHAFHAFMSGIMLFGSKILNVDANRLTLIVSTMFNDPDADWAILCDCGWTSILDLTSSDYGFSFILDDNLNPVGQWTNGIGLQATPVLITENRRQLTGSFNFDTSNITSYRLQGTFTRGTVPGFANGYVATYSQMELANVSDPVTRQQSIYSDYSVGIQATLDYTKNFDSNFDEFTIFGRSAIGATNGEFTVHTITITGTGTKPPQLP